MIKFINDIAIHISNFLKILIVILLILLFFQMQIIYDTNWCSSSIEILRQQISDLWYLNHLDEVDIVNE